MSTNQRIYYANHAVAIKNNSATITFTTGHLGHGVQSCGITSNFNLNPIFELGNISIYENVEGIPDVQVDTAKVLDGYCPLYLLATTTATSPTLAGRSTSRCDIGLAVYPDTNSFASGVPTSVCAATGMYINSISYTFSSDGNFTEDCSFVGNDKIWTKAPGTATGTPNYGESDQVTMPTITWNAHMASTDVPLATVGVAQSQDFMWDLPTGTLSADTNRAVNHPDVTVLPTEMDGITLSGTNPSNSDGSKAAHIQSAKVSVSLNRNTITELGRRGPYSRTVQFPTEVTSEFTVVSSAGDGVSHMEGGIFGTGTNVCSVDRTNLRHRTIRLCSCEGIRVYLGTKNKLSSVDYNGGDAGGGNVIVTYRYTTNNDFTIMHQNDSHASGATWWANRTTNQYLTQ